MKKIILLIAMFAIIPVLSGCASEDKKRVKALHAMPIIWESEILIIDPSMPGMKNIVPLYDSYDGSMAERMKKDKFTEDYIPEEVMAFKGKTYRNKPREITLRIGDTVSVLAQKTNSTKRKICLIRTQQNTYAWLYPFHLNDEHGRRMETFKQ